MTVSKNQVVDLLKLVLSDSQNAYTQVVEGIFPQDEQFIKLEFEILADQKAKRLSTNGLGLRSTYFRKRPDKISLSLTSNADFQNLAQQWQTTTHAFNTGDALSQLCHGIAAEHQNIYGLFCPFQLPFLEKFADAIIYAIQTGSYPVHCVVFLKDLWLEKVYTIDEPFTDLRENVPSICIRTPIVDDYIKNYSWERAFGCLDGHLLQIKIVRQTAVVEFFWFDKQPQRFPSSMFFPSLKFQSFQQSLDTIFLLIGNSSVRLSEFRYFGCSGGPGSINDSSPGRCVNINNLATKLKWVGELMLPKLMSDKKKDTMVYHALKYYQDSLFRSLGVESRIALTISGLEALYLPKKGAEITLKLSLLIAKLLSFLDFDPLAIKKNISKAYDIRSCHVHGSKVKKNDVQSMIQLSENIDEYLRLSILTFQYFINANLSIPKIVEELYASCFSDVLSKNIIDSLLVVKEILAL